MESKFDKYFGRVGTVVTIFSGIFTPQLTPKSQLILWSSLVFIFLLWLSNYLGRRHIRNIYKKTTITQPFNEVLKDLFRNLQKEGKDAEIIRWGLALSKPLWLSQNFELRREIGEYVETAAIKRDNKNALLKVLVDEIGWTTIEMLDYKSGEIKLNQAVQLAMEINDLPLLAKAYRHLNASCIRQNQISDAESYLTKSFDAANQIQASNIKLELNAEYYFAKATIELKKGNLEIAFNDIEESKRLYDHLKNNEWPLKIWARKGEILLALGRIEEAKNIFIKGIHIAKEQHYPRQQVKNEIGLSMCYSKDGHNRNASEHLAAAKLVAESLDMYYELDTINKEFIKIRSRH